MSLMTSSTTFNDTWNLPMTVINDVDIGHLLSSSSCTRAGGKCTTGKGTAQNRRFGGGVLDRTHGINN
eukprot:scaffold107224_cov33-Cyclotella_meneghiniana.AAC.1